MDGVGRHPSSGRRFLLALLTILPGPAAAGPQTTAAPCRIELVERDSGWPVPLVELRTTHNLRLVSDNAGLIAIDQPDLLGREVFFHVEGHGYEVPRDGFGFRGVRLTPQAGRTVRVELTRTVIARRLGRLTGAGLFAHSQKLGGDLDWPESGIVGCDSVQSAVHRGRRYWLWGDTSLLAYPLGIFHASSATTPLQPLASPVPPLRVPFDYFTDQQGRPRGVARMPGDGPTWLSGYVSLPDRDGRPRLVASYAKITPPLDAWQWGLCAWNDKRRAFEPLRVIWTRSDATPRPPPLPQGHAVLWQDDTARSWVLFGNPLPTLRCPSTFEAWQDPAQWEVLSPPATLPAAEDGEKIKPHSGSVAWHAGRRRWVTVLLEWLGKPSAFGELWYAEAAAPIGPWGPAVKILSHQNYTCYNPRVHADLTPPEAPLLLFEGTYTAQFADHPPPTPRYDYNQVLYRLDLDDPRLQPARELSTERDREATRDRDAARDNER